MGHELYYKYYKVMNETKVTGADILTLRLKLEDYIAKNSFVDLNIDLKEAAILSRILMLYIEDFYLPDLEKIKTDAWHL